MTLLTAAILSLAYGASAFSGADIKLLFGPGLSHGAQIWLPSDANYTEEVKQRWAVYQEPSYLGAIKPATERDVQTIIRIASEHQIPFIPTGGGHGTSGTLGGLHGGIEIDLSFFNSVDLDAERNRLTIGGAVVFGQIIDKLYEAGKELPTASASCVGVLGATLGAGLSTLQGLHGPLVDSLESVRIVTASGAILTASESENAELFWALRGAGHNFGIVTSATYRVYDATNGGQVVNADFLFPASANRSVWEVLRSYDTTLPPQLAVTIVVGANGTSREALVVVNAVFYGPMEQALLHLQPIIDIGPAVQNISMVPWNRELDAAFFNVQNGACIRQSRVNIYSLGIRETDVATWESHFNDLAGFYVRYPEYQGRLLVQRYSNQAALAVPDDRTAYAYRDATIQINLEGWYTDPSLDAAVNPFLQSARDKFQETSGYADLAVYTNYAHGDEGPEAWYSRRKLGRLVLLKKLWDPLQIFSWYNPI